MGTTLAATTTVKVETRNNQLEMQFVNNKALIEELDKLLKRLRILLEYATCLIGGSFDEARMLQYIKACEWLAGALNGLEPGEEKLDKIEQVMPKFCKNLCT
nr:exocyst complex, component EXOC1 [Tanacetum cinerariifolium]